MFLARKYLLNGRKSYADWVLATAPANLVGYLPTNELSGSTAKDASLGRRDGTYTGCTLGESGVFGSYCPLFVPGSGGRIAVSSWGGVITGQALSVHMFLRLDAGDWTDGQYRRWFDARVDANNRVTCYKDGGVPGRLVVEYINAGASTYAFAVPGQITTWFSLGFAVSSGGGYLRMFLCGNQVDTQSPAGFWSSNPSTVFIGCNDLTFSNWPRNIDEPAAWNTPLSEAQFQVLANRICS